MASTCWRSRREIPPVSERARRRRLGLEDAPVDLTGARQADGGQGQAGIGAERVLESPVGTGHGQEDPIHALGYCSTARAKLDVRGSP
jgi:hypothetical protein